MTDRFDRHADTVSAPARHAFAVVPHDGDPLAQVPKALWVSGAGTITLRAVESGADVVLTVGAGQILPIRVSHVRAAGTTATGIVGLA